MKILVCGGRDFNDHTMVERTLTHINDGLGAITCVIHGGAAGADALAKAWAESRSVPVLECPAQWKLYGRAAGPIRNKHMLTLGPQLVIAFPGGRGTQSMINEARASGLDVMEIHAPSARAALEAGK